MQTPVERLEFHDKVAHAQRSNIPRAADHVGDCAYRLGKLGRAGIVVDILIELPVRIVDCGDGESDIRPDQLLIRISPAEDIALIDDPVEIERILAAAEKPVGENPGLKVTTPVIRMSSSCSINLNYGGHSAR